MRGVGVGAAGAAATGTCILAVSAAICAAIVCNAVVVGAWLGYIAGAGVARGCAFIAISAFVTAWREVAIFFHVSLVARFGVSHLEEVF